MSTNEFFNKGKLTIAMDGGAGSSGKAKLGSYITDQADNFDFCANTFAPQAGHWTVLADGRKFFYQTLNSCAYNHEKFEKMYIGPGAIIELPALFREIEENGIPRSKIGISPVVAILDYEIDQGFEKGILGFDGEPINKTHEGTAKFGSTAHGVGSCAARKVLRRPSLKLARDIPELADMICDVPKEIMKRLDSGQSGFLELAQGFQLSQHYSLMYPYCLSGESKVLMADGTTKPIKNIKVGELVKTRNNIGKIAVNSVLNTWKKSAKNKTFYQLMTETTEFGSINNSLIGPKLTEDHKINTINGVKLVKDLVVGDKVYALEHKLNGNGLQVFLGSMLGDGTVPNFALNKKRANIQITHGAKQQKYLEAKAKILQQYIGGVVTAKTSTGFNRLNQQYFYSSSKSRDVLKLAQEIGCYGKKDPNFTKIVSFIDARGLAIWYQDDGRLKYNKYYKNHKGNFNIYFYTNGFGKESVSELASLLTAKFKINFKLGYVTQKGKQYPIIWLDSTQVPVFLNLIKNYVHPDLNYKVTTDVDTKWEWSNDEAIELLEEEILEIKIFDHVNSKRNKSYISCYDIEVENNHNFFVSNGKGYFNVENCTYRNITVAQGMSDMFLPTVYAGQVIINFRTFPIRINSNKYISTNDGRHLTYAEVTAGEPYILYEGDSGPGYFDQEEITWEQLTQKSGSPDPIFEITSVTKLPRRVFTFSAQNVREAIKFNDTGHRITTAINFVNYVDFSLENCTNEQLLTGKWYNWMSKHYPMEYSHTLRFIGTGANTESMIVLS
jgi:adenylosuccinate synthase